MSAFKVFLPDGKELAFDHAPTGLEVAHKIGPALGRDALGVKVEGEADIYDIRNPLPNGAKISIITSKHPLANEVIRHSAAHLMAQAVQELWPEIKVTIGPVIDSGFFYDFDSPRAFTPEDLEKIEKRMYEIAARDLEIKKEVWDSKTAIEHFAKEKERFKAEIIQDLKSDQVSIYRQGEWLDLCRGPHVQKTSQIKAFKLLSIAGAYWRGDEKREQLQRIYATAFADKKDLEAYLKQLEEAKKRDHRKLGKELGLFQFHPWAAGSPFFTGRGSIVYNQLIEYVRELYIKYGYEEVITPQLFDVEMFKTSGHYVNYKENMYFTEMDEREAGFKPMNCPAHCLMFASDHHSYRELPKRMADFGRLHRFERSGVMHGITRVRSFCQDDAHIFCAPEQLETEIRGFMQMTKEIYSTLGLHNYRVVLATRPAKRLGEDHVWDQAEGALASALTNMSIPFEYAAGEGAFYGPKVELHFVDAIGRSWQTGTIQCDYMLPENFKLGFIGEDNKEHRPVMLHRAILGSLERFIGVYLEHCSGHLPTWLSPDQAVILNVTDRQEAYGKELQARLQAHGIRVRFDTRNEKLGFKIREAQLLKVPYMIIIGDKEVEKKTAGVRLRNGQMVNDLDLEQVISGIVKDARTRSLSQAWGVDVKVNQEVSN